MKKVDEFYDSGAQREWERLDRHRIEFAVTKRAMADYLPRPPARLLDCGGGPGRYAIALAQQGYRVTLLDISAASLNLARLKASEAEIQLEDFIHGTALDLSRFPNGWFDAVLVMGPLYHLTRQEDRLAVTQEASRVLRLEGILMTAWITRYAPFRDAAATYPADIEPDLERWEQMRKDGVNFGGWTDAYFAMPDEVIPLMESCGLTTLALLGVGGLLPGTKTSSTCWMARFGITGWIPITVLRTILLCAPRLTICCILGRNNHAGRLSTGRLVVIPG
jgi:ubiquinone/menaquinone biosynthesis C-methylase UbiE